MFPITILDNFFETPTLVRQLALSQEYKKFPGNYPGKRTDDLEQINPEFNKYFSRKVLSLFFDFNKDNFSYNIDARFQLIDSTYEEGWAHIDAEHTIAGVIYLTPDAPIDSGTSVYRYNYKEEDFNWDSRNKSYNNEPIEVEQVRIDRNIHNSKFTKILDVGNIYNRLFLYNGNQYHRENKFFGDNDNNCRLTLVFFADVIVQGSTMFPITKCKQSITY